MQPTIKDIAKATGVSQGTVSNVLNKKGNVSVKKIKLVEQAAQELGYKINNKAKILRQGDTNSLAVILPSLNFPEYIDIYTNAKDYANKKGYSTHLFITNDIPALEKDILKEIISLRINGIISVSCLDQAEAYYRQSGLSQVGTIFLERNLTDSFPFAGFDYFRIGNEIGSYAANKGYKNIAVFTGDSSFSNHTDIVRGIESQTRDAKLLAIGSHINQIHKDAFALFADNNKPDLVVVTSQSLVDAVLSAHSLGSISQQPEILCVSSLRTYPNPTLLNYSLNYKALGEKACEQLIGYLENAAHPQHHVILPADGFGNLFHAHINEFKEKELNVLFLDCPSTTALKKLSPDFTKRTGIKVNFHVFPLPEIYDVIDTMTDSGVYDVIRLDMAWLSWFAEKSFLPLHSVNPEVENVFSRFLPAIKEKYCCVNDQIYALPFDPSVQMMFYRSDLFEDAFYKRAFFEDTKSHLQVPQTFEEYNKVVRFFTKQYNPDSPTEFGATVAVGYPTSIAAELMSRILSQPNMFDKRGRLDFNSSHALMALNSYIETAQYANVPEGQWWQSVVNSFSSGMVATTIVYTNYAADIIHAQDSAVAGKIGFAKVPGQKPIIGGGVLGISKYSAKVDEAYAFLDWASSEDIASKITMIGGTSPCTSTYKNMDVIRLYPWLQHLSENILIGERKKIFSLSEEVINQRTFEHAFGMAIKNAILGIFTAEEAMSYSAKLLERAFIS